MNYENKIAKLEAKVKELEYVAFETKRIADIFLELEYLCDTSSATEDSLAGILMRTAKYEHPVQIQMSKMGWGFAGTYKDNLQQIIHAAIDEKYAQLESVEDTKCLTTEELCELFADADPKLTASNAANIEFPNFAFDDLDYALITIKPNTAKATSKQMNNIKALNKFKNTYYYYVLSGLLFNEVGINPELVKWCADHPEELNKAVLDLFADGNTDVSEILQPLVKCYQIIRK